MEKVCLFRLEDKVALVTGGGSGMGRAISRAYAFEGAKVMVADLNLETAQETVDLIKEEGGEAQAIQGNVAIDDECIAMIEATIDSFGTLDILVNNAGIMDGFQPVGEVDDGLFERVMAVNTNSVLYTMRRAVKHFLGHGGGIIVNIASAGGLFGFRAGLAYTASKHAVVGMTKNTAFAYAGDNIRCNAIAPGAVETNIGSTMQNLSEKGAQRQSLGMGINPRVGQAEEIAKAAVFLASDDSSFVNGEVLLVDGGWGAY